MSFYSQKKAIKTFEITTDNIEISTKGLDNLTIENSPSNFVEITLFAASPLKQHIVTQENKGLLNINFNIEELPSEKPIFRKYITERLQRAYAVIKIPIGKKVIVFGNSVNIESKSLESNLDIYIEKGILKLHTVKANSIIKLFEGSVFATLKNTNTAIVTRNGIITIDKKREQDNFYKNQINSNNHFKVTSINANIYLTTQ